MNSSNTGDNNQKSTLPAGAQSEAPWSTGLCACSDPGLCCLTCWFPCITFGRIAEIVDRGETSCITAGAIYVLIALLTGVPCLYSCFYRQKMRQQFMLQESPCPDCCAHFWCEGNALVQEYIELQNRGFDMSIGWHGNMEKQTRGVAMAPVAQGGMTR